MAVLPGVARSTFAGCHLPLARRWPARPKKGMSGAPTSRSDVEHHRNAGWPTGRESQGHGVLVVVGDGESPSQGEGGQVGRPLKGKGSEMDNCLTRLDAAQLESCLR